MEPTRRRILRVASVGTVTTVVGCGRRVNRGGTAVSSDSPTDAPTPSDPPTVSLPPKPTDCPTEPRVPDGTPDPNGAEIPRLPDPPDSVTSAEPIDPEAVAEFVKQYELVYRWRDFAEGPLGPLTEVFLEGVVEVRTAKADWVIVDVTGFLAGNWDPDPTETGAPGNFDNAEYRASYLVTREAVWRAQTEPGGDNYDSEYAFPDPAADGELLECF